MVSVSLQDVVPDDLVRFGMIPEFVGRFPNTVCLQELEDQDLVSILTSVRHNLLEQYRWLFAQDGVDLVFESEAIDAMVKRAKQSGTGARSLHSEMERVLMPHMYCLKQYQSTGTQRVVIDPDQVNNPRLLSKG